MSHENYTALLVAANLARYTNGMLYIKRTQWELFLRGYYFSDVAFEMEKKKMMLGSSNKRQASLIDKSCRRLTVLKEKICPTQH